MNVNRTGPLFVVAGARPNFVKVAPILRAAAAGREALIVETSQHYDPRVSDTFFVNLQITHPLRAARRSAGTRRKEGMSAPRSRSSHDPATDLVDRH